MEEYHEVANRGTGNRLGRFLDADRVESRKKALALGAALRVLVYELARPFLRELTRSNCPYSEKRAIDALKSATRIRS